MKQAKLLTRKQYMAKFSRAARWRLSPQDAAEAIADYRELVYQEERDETRLAEELGDPVQAAWLLADAATYRRWLAVFAVLVYGLFLLAKWVYMAHSPFTYIFGYEPFWYPVWTMAVGAVLSLVWFRRHGQKSGSMPRWLLPALAAALLFGLGTMAWIWHVMDPSYIKAFSETPSPHWQITLLADLTLYGGAACALAALAGLILARCQDRRWLALYILGLTVAAMFGFVVFNLKSMNLSYPEPDMIQAYLFARLIPIGAAGLIGTGVALC